jgi:hypothetical protein
VRELAEREITDNKKLHELEEQYDKDISQIEGKATIYTTNNNSPPNVNNANDSEIV